MAGFATADVDNSGDITLAEYLDFMAENKGGDPVVWVNRFNG